jgi:HTH-type transcriptional regulator / antitoxin HipB
MRQVLSMADQAGPLLRGARKAAGLSQTALARQLGLSQRRMSAMELNPGSISLEQLLALLAALDLELVVQAKPPAPDKDEEGGRRGQPQW